MFAWLTGLFQPDAPITRATIDRLPPRKLWRKVLSGLPDAEHANRSQRDLVRMILLDGEVCNGGFIQYYYNSGEDGRQAEQAFVRAGADDAARLIGQANDLFESERERLRTRWDGTAKGFAKSYRLKLFDAFDSEYYALMKNGRFDRLAAGFIRRHAEDFFTDR